MAEAHLWTGVTQGLGPWLSAYVHQANVTLDRQTPPSSIIWKSFLEEAGALLRPIRSSCLSLIAIPAAMLPSTML